MAIFNQQGQHVQNQYNAGGDILIEAQNTSDLVKHLEHLMFMIDKAAKEGAIDTATAAAVNQELQKASTEEKPSIIERLSKVTNMLKGITATESIVSNIKALITSISKWLI
jgi:hypothetical protein